MARFSLRKFIDDRRGAHFDYNLFAVVILLMAFGLVMLYSASSYEAMNLYGNDMYYFLHQGAISLFAIGVCLIVSLIDYHLLVTLAIPGYIISIGLMAAVKYSPLGYSASGAKRWLRFGSVSFQPSEFAKIAVILVIVYMIMRLGRDISSFSGIIKLFALGFIAAFCAYYFTENLSTAIIIFAISVAVIFIAHPKTKGFIIFFIIVALLIAVGIAYLSINGTEVESFRITRILVWLDPEKYADEGGWQVIQGLYAIGSGGLLGKGLGNSTQKLDIIPEAQNDMIFTIICEELGLFGAILLLILFGYLLYRLFLIGKNAPDMQGMLIISGIFSHIAIQIILNICVVLNIIPTTGVSLPWVSYGGTSVCFLMIEIGIALNISGNIRNGVVPARNRRDRLAQIRKSIEKKRIADY